MLRSAIERLDALERKAGSYDELAGREMLLEQRQTSAEEHQAATSDEANATAVNAELLKGEVRQLRATVEELGFAIAPAAGLEGAQTRLAELRERLNGLDRRLRHLAATVERGSAGVGAASDGTPPAPEPAAERDQLPSELFDYVGFERRFRGDPERVSETLWARYGALLRERGPVLDIGCGTGQLISRLQEAGVTALGVDTDTSMVAEAQAQGLTVHRADANEYLESQPEGTFGAIVATQLVEHLPLAALVRLLELSVSRLRPGGILVAETPNPESLIVLGNSYILDPTHVWPMHPSLLVFLCESAGFRDVRLQFFSPAEAYHLQLVQASDAPECAEQVNTAFERLNKVLFGPQDYAAIATTPA